jgi:hypothetical protein
VRKRFEIVYVKKKRQKKQCYWPPSRSIIWEQQQCCRIPSTQTDCEQQKQCCWPPLHGSAAGVQEAEISDGKGNELEPAGIASDEHRSVDGAEQVAGHSSADSSSDWDSVKCPVCSVTFTTQEVGTPDACDHTFCAACLQ